VPVEVRQTSERDEEPEPAVESAMQTESAMKTEATADESDPKPERREARGAPGV